MNHSTRGGDARQFGSNFRCNRNLPRGEGPHHRIGRIEFANRTPEIQGIALSTNMADHAAVSPGHLTILLKCGRRRKRNRFLGHVRTIPLPRRKELLATSPAPLPRRGGVQVVRLPVFHPAGWSRSRWDRFLPTLRARLQPAKRLRQPCPFN